MLRQLACPLGAGLCSVLRTVWRLGLVQNCQHVLYGSGRWEPSDDCPSIRCFRGQRDFDCIAIRRPASGVKPRAPRWIAKATMRSQTCCLIPAIRAQAASDSALVSSRREFVLSVSSLAAPPMRVGTKLWSVPSVAARVSPSFSPSLLNESWISFDWGSLLTIAWALLRSRSIVLFIAGSVAEEIWEFWLMRWMC